MVQQEKNFLPRMFFEKLSFILNGSDFAWFFNPSSVEASKFPFIKDTHFMFTHSLWNEKGKASNMYEVFEPILDSLSEKIKINKLLRMKLNLYTNQNKKIKHTVHCDYIDKQMQPYKNINITILNFTSCNGGTIINKKFYSSNANEALIFDNSLEHQGIVQTDVPIRIVLNIGWQKNAVKA